MALRRFSSYRVDKNLGKAYNSDMSLLADDDWAILTDWDILFLLPETIAHIQGYIDRFPGTGIFTCYASRTHHINTGLQMFESGIDPSDSILHHIKIAKKQTAKLYEVTPINRFISGFLMVISKATWDKIKFVEDLKCLHVDNIYSNRIIEAGLPILRMDGVYVYHIYRLDKDIKNTDHLQ